MGGSDVTVICFKITLSFFLLLKGRSLPYSRLPEINDEDLKIIVYPSGLTFIHEWEICVILAEFEFF